VSCDPFFNFDAHNHISGMAEVTVNLYIKCLADSDWLLPNGCGQGHVTHLLCLKVWMKVGCLLTLCHQVRQYDV